MSTKYTGGAKQTPGFQILSSAPIDDRKYFRTLADVDSFVHIEGGFGRLHDGAEIMITDEPSSDVMAYTTYIWTHTVEGLLDTPHIYNGWAGEYANKPYNFVPADASTVVEMIVFGGTTNISIDERFLPLNARVSGVISVVMYEYDPVNPTDLELVIPNAINFERNIITGVLQLMLRVAPPYGIDTHVKLKIS